MTAVEAPARLWTERAVHPAHVCHDVGFAARNREHMRNIMRCRPPLESSTDYRVSYVQHRPTDVLRPPSCRPTSASTNVFPPEKQRTVISTYVRDYHAKDVNEVPRESFRPKNANIICQAPISNKTTNREDFQTWHVEKPEVRVKSAYVTPTGEHNMLTTHQREYTEKPIERKLERKAAERSEPGDFDGRTNYRADYVAMELPRLQVLPPIGACSKVHEPFRAKSSYDDSYTCQKAEPRQCIKPHDNKWLDHCTKDDMVTGYQTEYIRHAMPKTAISPPICKLRGPHAELESVSNYRKDYSFKPNSLRKPYRPEQTPAPTATFCNKTTQRSDFRTWDTQRPQIHKPDTSYIPPAVLMNHISTTKHDFTTKPICMATSTKPAPILQEPSAFDGRSNYRIDYRPPVLEPIPQREEKSPYIASKTPFSKSYYQDTFNKKDVCPPKSARPLDNFYQF